jgi:eukaryotic-like serine/threonine-protein kinase
MPAWMPVGSDAQSDARFANLDANAIIELCSSLADYGEAGGLSAELMMQVGRYAEARYSADIDVLLAIARMYLLGGEAQRARDALLRAGKLGSGDGRVLPLLSQALKLLGDPRTAERALADAPASPPSEPTPSPAPTSGSESTAIRARATTTPRAKAQPAPLKGAKREAFTPTTPFARRDMLESRHPTTPIPSALEQAPAASPMQALLTRMPGHGPSHPTTPIKRPGYMAPDDGRSSAGGQAARDLASRTPAPGSSPQPPPARTAISRRASPSDPALEARLPPASPLPAPSSIARTTRIRPLEPDDPRRCLDPYELIGEIASGGMATVFLGRLAGHGGFSRLVAIKQLHPHLAHEEQFVQMFLDEARLAAGIHHPHVVPILEVGMSKAGYFLVMEFIEGDTLSGLTARSLQAGAILPAPVTVRVVLDALAGLHAAHQLADAEGRPLGLVHRDCTPQNVLVGVDGSARITDFGVARAASRLAITRPHQVKGKVAYLSPEQAHAMDLDRRSDLFTMGIVLWEGLAGRSLFQADTEAATLSRLTSAPIPSVRSLVPDVPTAIDEVCRRALHRDRSRRFRSAAEMAEALELAASAEGFPGAASPRELGAFVEATLGADLIAQREAVRTWLAPVSAAPRTVSASFPSKPPPSMRGPASGGARGDVITMGGPESPPKPPEVVTGALLDAGPLAPSPSPAPVIAAVDRTLPEGTPSVALGPLPTPAPPGKITGPGAPVRGILARVTSIKMSTGRGVALALLVVLVATAPLWLGVTRRALRGPRPTPAAPSASAPPGRAASPSKTKHAWDEGDWGLPEAGLGSDDSPPDPR